MQPCLSQEAPRIRSRWPQTWRAHTEAQAEKVPAEEDEELSPFCCAGKLHLQWCPVEF